MGLMGLEARKRADESVVERREAPPHIRVSMGGLSVCENSFIS